MKSLNEKLEDLLTELHPPYESKEELRIGRMLDRYRIPFFYKQPTLVVEHGHRRIEYVRFFLPTYGGLAMDYISDPKGDTYRSKVTLYGDNLISAMLLTRRDLSGLNWQQRLYEKLEQLYHQPLASVRHAPEKVPG